MAVARLGKQVIELVDVTKSYGENTVLRDVTFRLAPGERLAILGANGAGKSTLLGVMTKTLPIDKGLVKHGKTVKLGILDQEFSQLKTLQEDRVTEILDRLKTTVTIDGKEVTPSHLLGRLGFSKGHLYNRVLELSGGQKRRLQFLLVLLSEPNVLILDEPTNDVDTDMLTAIEDLLDSWPGTLIVVSHDRYLIERIADNFYRIDDGKVRHLPGGVDEYLSTVASTKTTTNIFVADTQEKKNTGGQEAFQAQKNVQAAGRKVEKLTQQIAGLEEELAKTEYTDYQKLADLGAQVSKCREQLQQAESVWLDAMETLEQLS